MTLMEEYVKEVKPLILAMAVPLTFLTIIFGLAAIVTTIILLAFGTPIGE